MLVSYQCVPSVAVCVGADALASYDKFAHKDVMYHEFAPDDILSIKPRFNVVVAALFEPAALESSTQIALPFVLVNLKNCLLPVELSIDATTFNPANVALLLMPATISARVTLVPAEPAVAISTSVPQIFTLTCVSVPANV